MAVEAARELGAVSASAAVVRGALGRLDKVRGVDGDVVLMVGDHPAVLIKLFRNYRFLRRKLLIIISNFSTLI